jgi:hypothetical protein
MRGCKALLLGEGGKEMITIVKRPKLASALILIEAMIAMAVLAIAALGVLSHQYHAAAHARIARAQITGTRTAQLLLEDWKSTGGSEEYDVTTLGLGFSSRLPIPSLWSQGRGQGLGSPLHNSAHPVIVDDLPMLVVLRWQDVAHDTITEVKLRQLTVIVRFGETDDKGNLTFSENYMENIPPIILTTYARVDASSG